MTRAALGPNAISLTKLRDLDLEAPSQLGRRAHLAAASGLVCVHDILYVVADDEVHLGAFARSDPAPGRLLRLRSTTLDLEPKVRKRAKPDFEALVALPPSRPFEHGGLLALGSGSTAQRMSATCIPLDPAGRVLETPYTFALEPLYAAIARAVDEVNIEGAIVRAGELLLFQRGNRGRGVNAVLGFDMRCIVDAIAGSELRAEPRLSWVREYDLGSIGPAPLSFTDATLLPDGSIVFTTVAEETADAYADGPCAGAAIGMLAADGELLRMWRITQAAKIEGLHAELHGSTIELLLVSDADDAQIPAALFRAALALD